MTIFNGLFLSLAFLAFPLAAQDGKAAPTEAHPAQGAPTVQALAASPADAGCSVKGCPQLDPSGQKPVNCAYQSGMSTGWRCILMCTYPGSTWGTIVDGSNCR